MKRIGDILLEAGVLESTQLQYALTQPRLPGERLGTLLIRLGMLTEDLLAKALARQMHLPILDLTNMEIPEKILRMLPREMLMQYNILPIALKNIAGKPNLIVAMADPTLMHAIALLEGEVPYPIRPGVASERSIHSLLEKYFGRFEKNQKKTIPEPPEGVLERTASVSVKIPAAMPKVESQDTEITVLTHTESGPADPDIMRELTEPTHHNIRLDTLTRKEEMRIEAPEKMTPMNPAVNMELRELVQVTNKNVLLEALLQLLLDRKIVTVEDLLAAVELKK